MVKWVAAVAALVLMATACSSGGGTGRDGDKDANRKETVTRTAEANGITVTATWLGGSDIDSVDADLRNYPPNEFVLIELSLDTHSGDLSEIDLEREALLNQAVVDLRAEAWVGTSDDSHHRSGVLVFLRPLEDGPVELTVGIGDEEVALTWEEEPAA